MVIVIVEEIPGSAPVATIKDDAGNQVSCWVGYNGHEYDLDLWLRVCNYDRVSFDTIEETEHTKTWELAQRSTRR